MGSYNNGLALMSMMLGAAQLAHGSPVAHYDAYAPVDIPEYHSPSAPYAVEIPEHSSEPVYSAVETTEPAYSAVETSEPVYSVPESKTHHASASYPVHMPESSSESAHGVETTESKAPHPTAPVYTTEVVTAITTYCPGATTLTHNDKTYTITKPMTLTITDCPGGCTVTKPVETMPPKHTGPADYPMPSGPAEHPEAPKPTGPAGHPEECPAMCAESYDMCRGKPDANRASCAAEYSECLGYVPFGPDGSLITPTACSSQPKPTAPAPKPDMPAPKPTAPAYNTPEAPAPKPDMPAPKPDMPTGPAEHPEAPKPTGAAPPYSPVAPHDCPAMCSESYDMCRGKPDANRASCAAEYSQCLGYAPFGPDGSLITPTACSTTAAATGTGSHPMIPTGAVETPVSTPVVVAGAGRVSATNIFVALGAIGVAALAAF
ncbi:hypothetical protein FZEAL_2207 [Fusarium zealandicum]|uniref:Cell wall glycoprotein n=1 Tax=Fusarium zealandicum TaxID=1053134 RepID=A0A8H4URI8_9HYPO|nr:hypothetical protein FZEAL_2207 [Fusarium zealandicum]